MPFGSSSKISCLGRVPQFYRDKRLHHEATVMRIPRLCFLNEAAIFRLPQLLMDNEASLMRLPQLSLKKAITEATSRKFPVLDWGNG